MAQQRQHRRNDNAPGHAHELTCCGYPGLTFLNAESASKWLAAAIEAARFDLNFDPWADVFMPEHVHLMVRPREAEYDIADIRKAIKAPVGSKAMIDGGAANEPGRPTEARDSWDPPHPLGAIICAVANNSR